MELPNANLLGVVLLKHPTTLQPLYIIASDPPDSVSPNGPLNEKHFRHHLRPDLSGARACGHDPTIRSSDRHSVTKP